MNEQALQAWIRRHLRWLLCFALLLPVAQVAGAVHLLSHLAPTEQRRGSQDAADPAQCQICPLAAAISSGGAPSTPPVLRLDVLPAAQIAQAVPGRAGSTPRRLFDSRGPPSLLH
ncbi:hypothetical protein [Ramlibacter sp.]|uniref:hypothetical protein n=1 Tax=Ramlibacter sp. TaxID=1917967 RepID=UPI00262078E4|nr:hypothetical protein [Ramlibacter sp.]MDB5954002.1 hypothetical protein [Ramlibacter sp.]